MNRPPIFSADLLEAIRSAGEAMHQTLHEYSRDPVPDRETLRCLVETAFFVSLRTEEGRSLSLRLTHLSKFRLEERGRLGGNIAVIGFGDGYPCTVDELAKLASSHKPRTASFVAVGTQPDLRIAGMVQFGPDNTSLGSSHRFLPPMGFGIHTKGPGRLAITFGDRLVGVFEDGEFHRPEPEALHAIDGLGGMFFNAASAHSWHQVDRSAYAAVYLQCIEELFYAMSVRGHGGTVLWVPTGSLAAAEKFLLIGRRIEVARPVGVERIQLALLQGDGADVRRRAREDLREYIGMLGQFACVDGALVVDDMLKPIGYGAKIVGVGPTTAEVVVMRKVDPVPFYLEKRGTRHTSAANFVCAVPGTIALVLSQDGPARAFFHHDGKLLVWPDCRTSVFV